MISSDDCQKSIALTRASAKKSEEGITETEPSQQEEAVEVAVV